MVHLLPARVLVRPLPPTLWNCPPLQLLAPSMLTAERAGTDAPAAQAVCGPHRNPAAGKAWVGDLPSPGKKHQFSFVHKITANKLQITQDTFIIDLCRGAESSITFCLAQGA